MAMHAPVSPRQAGSLRSLRSVLRGSIRWRLSVVVSGLVLVVVAALVALAYREVEGALLRAGRSRADAAAGQLSALLMQSSRQRLGETRRLAAHHDVQRFLEMPDAGGRERILALLRGTSGQQSTRMVIWSAGGSRLLDVTSDPQPGVPSLAGAPSAVPAHDGISELKSHDGMAFYDTIAVIRLPQAPDTPGGHVVLSRALSSTAAADLITRLIGSSATIRLGNRGGGVWTDLSAVVPAPPVDARAAGVSEYDVPDGRRLAAVAPVDETPWAVIVEFPRAAVLEPARSFLWRIVVLAVPFVLLAAAATRWLMGRIARPLHELTDAAEAIAAGHYARRVDAAREDELGRLGGAFNTMAGRVEAGVQQLESRVRERTTELEHALAELRSAQEDAVRREKLAMLGQLASGVGHELRNPLGVMTNAVYYLEMIQADADAEVREYLGILRGQIGVADRIVTDLLDFARIKPPQIRAVSLAGLVDEQLARLGPLNGIEVEREFPEDLPPVWIDAGQVGQVVLNLLTNAVQAMDERGVLTLRGRLSADGVALEVQDTGSGIAPELQQKIFEPLFTTKARGIGLGLAVSRSLAQANGGALAVSSRPGEGATFTLKLPDVQGAAA